MATKKPSTTRKTGSKNVAPGEGTAVSKTKVRVNLEGVTARARKAVRIPEGDYLAKVTAAEVVKVKSKGENTGKPQVRWQFTVEEGKHRGVGPFYYNTGLWQSSIWSFRGVLQALKPNFKIPESAADIDLSKAVGRLVAITLVDDEYDNKIKSSVDDVFHPDLLAEDEEDDEEDEDSDESDEDDEEEDLDEDDDELDEEDEEDEEPEDEDDDDVDLDEEDL